MLYFGKQETENKKQKTRNKIVGEVCVALLGIGILTYTDVLNSKILLVTFLIGKDGLSNVVEGVL